MEGVDKRSLFKQFYLPIISSMQTCCVRESEIFSLVCMYFILLDTFVLTEITSYKLTLVQSHMLDFCHSTVSVLEVVMEKQTISIPACLQAEQKHMCNTLCACIAFILA